MDIGNVALKNNYILGPMAGVTDTAFRLICSELGAGLVCAEMVSAKAVSYHNKNTIKMLETEKTEHPVSMQLFGSEPDILGEVTASLQDLDFEIIDFNMGCPVPKVVGNGEGSALMKNPRLAGDILKAMVKNSPQKPVTVKIRKGWDAESVNAAEIAKIAEDAGVSAIAVHARTRSQYYSGEADWELIYEAAQRLSIPVYGNGDLFDAVTAVRRLHDGPVAGLVIARGALGNPWLFGQIQDLLAGREMRKPDLATRMQTALRHLDMQLSWKPERVAVAEMRKHISWYLHGVRGAASIRNQVNRMESTQEVRELLSDLALHGEETW